jgi:REP element-mobilizing transposase RayT
LHGSEAGSVDRNHNVPGSPLIEVDPKRVLADQRQMGQPPYLLDEHRRAVVLASLMERCTENHWHLLAAHVRTNHVHVVIEADIKPERIMNDLKSYASRCLNASETPRKRWTRHGSTRWLWNPENVTAAIGYVLESQGEPMAVYEAEEPLHLVAAL